MRTRTTLNDILFPVSKVKNPEFTNSEYAYKIIGEVDGSVKVLNYCSKDYQLVDNALIFQRIETLLTQRGIDYTVEYDMINHARFYARYIIHDLEYAINMGNNDIVKPQIVVHHSYNGLTKYKITFGYYRMICENGLVIPLEGHEEKNLNIQGKHTKKIIESVDLLMDKLDYFFAINDQIAQRFEVLTDKVVTNWTERVEAVISATGIGATKTQLSEIEAVIRREASDLYGGSVNEWLIYNGINWHIYNATKVNANGTETKLKAAPETRELKDRKVLNYMLENA